jgi:ATP-dependent DNA helicase RecG
MIKLITQGKTKGLSYLVNPDILKSVSHNMKPSLKTLEPHALKALIFEDLKIHPNSKASKIAARLPDTPLKEIRKLLYKGVKDDEIMPAGKNKNRTYSLANKK